MHLFDIDGTLMLSAGAGGRAFERACVAVLGPTLGGVFRSVTFHGNTDPAILDEGCQIALGRPALPEEAEAVFARYLELLHEELLGPGRVTVLPGVHELLARLQSRGIPIGLVTGNLREGARLKLTAAGLWGSFSFGGFADDARERAAIVEVALRRAPASAGDPPASQRSRVTLVGDTPRDVAAARAAGIRAVAVATGMHSVAELRACGADEVHATLATYLH